MTIPSSMWGVLPALIACAACASSGRQTAGQPSAREVTLNVAAESIVWSAERRLKWSDFAGRPDAASDAAALTVYLLSYDGTCRDNVFDMRVFSAFLPDQSWVKTNVLLARSEVIQHALAHEQTHFDLSEVSARQMRRALAALKNPCAMSDEALNAVVDPFIRADFERQRRYDRETLNGSHGTFQRDWEMRVARELAELAKYVR